jgi:hypothetical protein
MEYESTRIVDLLIILVANFACFRLISMKMKEIINLKYSGIARFKTVATY